MSKFCLIVILALTICSFATAQDLPCQGTCNLAFRCSPYFKQPIYSIVNGECRVWQNSCFFSSENCSRRNQCLQEFVQTTQEECLKHCSEICLKNYKPICASFPRTNEDGTNVFVSVTFGNKCELARHVCQNGDAYVNEPTDGKCEETEEAEQTEDAVETDDDEETEQAEEAEETEETGELDESE